MMGSSWAEELPPIFQPGNLVKVEFSMTEGVGKGPNGKMESGTSGYYKIVAVSGKWIQVEADNSWNDESLREEIERHGNRVFKNVGWLNTDFMVNVVLIKEAKNPDNKK